MFRVSNLDISIGPVPIIRDASLTVSEGDMCGLIGRNGAGKTTLIRALMGALPATGKAELGHVEQEAPSLLHPLVDPERVVHARVVDEPFPADGGAGLFEIGPHDE